MSPRCRRGRRAPAATPSSWRRPWRSDPMSNSPCWPGAPTPGAGPTPPCSPPPPTGCWVWHPPPALRLAWEQLALGRLLDREAPDVHHGPHYTMPERTRRPVVVTIHDCTFFDHPSGTNAARPCCSAGPYGWRLCGHRCSSVSAAPPPSGWSRSARCAPRSWSPPTAWTTTASRPRSRPRSDALALGAIGVDTARPYIAFVGTLEPRKGVADLVAAFDRLASRHPELALVVAGQPGWGDTGSKRPSPPRRRAGASCCPATCRRYRRPIAAQGLGGRLPSIEEGYGLPALEALACGAPLVTTRGTAMEEVAGDAAWLVAPRSPEELAGALDAVLSGPRTPPRTGPSGWPRPPGARGRRARSATWPRTAWLRASGPSLRRTTGRHPAAQARFGRVSIL